MFNCAILTASDKGSKNEREDKSKEVIEEILTKKGWNLKAYKILPDDKYLLAKEMIRMSDEEKVDLILTTGGTGFSKRDVTPEATKLVIEKEALGIVEAIRMNSMKITKRAMLSRATSGIRNQTLIINLPGSPKAVRESLEFVIDTLEHGLEILLQRDSECAR